MEEQIDCLIVLLSDGRPARERYRVVVGTVGYELALWKAQEIQSSSSARNPAAVFFAWAKRQPAAPQPTAPKPDRHIDSKSGDVVLHDITDSADELPVWDEAVARLA